MWTRSRGGVRRWRGQSGQRGRRRKSGREWASCLLPSGRTSPVRGGFLFIEPAAPGREPFCPGGQGRRPYIGKMRVLLFDIDGTLIRSGGAGKAAMEAALKSAFGIEEVRDQVAYSGRTDPGIVRELLALHDIEPTDANAVLLKSAYLAQLPGMLRRIRGSVLPGIEEALRRERQGSVVGLLTGNIRAGAEIKLRHYGLWDYFPFGGFADGLLDRDDVARRALGEAEHHGGKRG